MANSNATDLTDFQVSFTLDTASLINAGKLQSECQDIRVTDIGGKELPHWIEENNPGCNSATTKVWVKMPSLSRSGGTLYAYYGNASAPVSPNHDGNKVFEFFDDFESYELGPLPTNSKWGSRSGSWVIIDSRFAAGSKSLTVSGVTGNDSMYWLLSNYQNTTGILEGLVYSNSNLSSGGDAFRQSLCVAIRDDLSRGICLMRGAVSHSFRFLHSNVAWGPPGYNYSFAENAWYNFQLMLQTDFVKGKAWELEQPEPLSPQLDWSYSTRSGNYFGLASRTDINGFDNIHVRKVATSEPIATPAAEETVPGPIAYWKFDEDGGSTAHDSAGNNAGTITGATWANENQCVSGKCLSFDGVDDFVDVPDDQRLEGMEELTISFWAKHDTGTFKSWEAMLTKGDSGDSYRIHMASNRVQWVVETENGYSPATSTFTPTAGVWYHVVGTYKNGAQKLYINGVSNGSSNHTGTVNSSAYPVTIGKNSRSSGRNWDGLIDEVKIFPYALTEDQIKAEYNLGAAAVIGTGPAAPPPAGGNLDDSLVAHWAFDEQSGQTAHDKVGTNHGTLGADTNPGSDDPTWKPASECKVNGCLGFDGTNNFITNSSPENLPTGSQATWTWWSKSSATGWSANALLGDNRSLWSIRQSSNYLYLGLGGEESGATASFSTDVNWSHYAITFNSGSASFFKNGEMIGNYSFTNTTVPALSTLYVGRRSTVAAPYFFNGLIDEVKIYNTALTPEQVLQDMNAGASLTVGVGADEADEIIDGAGAPPIAEWKFDEKQGTTVYDTSGNGNDGTVNGATWKSGCQQGACLEFDGSNQNTVALPLSAAINAASDESFTWELWLNPEILSGSQVVMSATNENGFGDSQTLAEFNIGRSPGKGEWLVNTSGKTIPVDIAVGWQHWAGLKRGDEMEFYINGALQGTVSAVGNVSFKVPTTFRIGAPATDERYFSGLIDHVKIYDYARTPAQIAYDYNRGAPVAHWKFDECEGTVAHDSSGNGNHGTINIGPSGSQSTAGTCQTSGAWANGKDGKFNGSLNFDGTDDVVAIPDYSLTTEQITMTAWIKPYSVSGMILGIIVSRSASNDVESLNTKYGNLGYSWGPDYSSNLSIPINQWSFAAVTIGPDKATLYLSQNGKMVSETQNREHSTRTLQGLKIGNDDVVSNRFFPGQIDDVRIYNYALSPAQVLKVYNQGQAVNFTREN